MKVTFLGTSHGVPASDRFCSSIMIESGNSYYLIDAGAPVADLLLRYGKRTEDLRAVFTTHSHGDHVGGILHLADLINWYYKDAQADIYMTDQNVIDSMRLLIEAMDPAATFDAERVRFKLTSADTVYEDENIRVEFIPTKHMWRVGKPSYSVLVTEGEKRVLFSGDFSHELNDVPELLSSEHTDAFVCEMAHFGAAAIKPYLRKAKTSAIYFTHVYPLEKYSDIELMKGELDCPVYCPKDGDSFEL